jgi:hypothetical protein
MTKRKVGWTYDLTRTLRGLGGIALSVPFGPGEAEEDVFESLLHELGRSFDVVPYTAVVVCGREYVPGEGMRFTQHPAEAIATKFPAVRGSLYTVEGFAEDGTELAVASLRFESSLPAATYMLASQDAIVILAPAATGADLLERAAMLVLSAGFTRRTEEPCMRLLGHLARTEALMIPEGSHDDRYRTLRLFCGEAALSRLQGSLHRRWRPLRWVLLDE